MNEAAARDYSEAFGMIGAGWWRQVAWAQKQGIPAALGMNTREWVTAYVGGWARLALEDRQDAVRELTAEGMNKTQVGDVLGVSRETVARDLGERTDVRQSPDTEHAERTDARLFEDYASNEALRDAAVLRVKAAIQGAAAAIEAVTPPIDAEEAEAEGLTATASYILRQLNRGRKLEAVK